MFENARRKSYFPSIPSPNHKLKNSTELLRRKRSMSPHPGHYSQLDPPSYRSIHYDDFKSDERVVSHFLLKYLSRKEQYENKYSDYSDEMDCLSLKDDLRIDPRFRRVYHRKVKQEKKYP